MVNFGYPYNDLVICKDSTDYLVHYQKINVSISTYWMTIILLLLYQESYYLALQYNIVTENIVLRCSKVQMKYFFHTYLSDNNVTCNKELKKQINNVLHKHLKLNFL